MNLPDVKVLKSNLKTILPRTLFGRSLLILILPILLLQILSTFIFFDRHWTKVTSRLAFAVAGEIALAADRIEADPSESSVADVSARLFRALDIRLSYYHGGPWTDGQGAEALDDLFISRILRFFLEERVGRPTTLASGGPGHEVIVRIRLRDGVLVAYVPQRRLFSSTGFIFLMWSAGLSILLLSVSILFMRNQIRPIRKLALAAERFGKGRDTPSFKPEGAAEVRQAGRAFLDMRDRIRRQIDQRTSMLAGISHDLRTPLTRMKLQLALMPSTPDTAAMTQDVEAMERMIAAYLDFVRGEGDETPRRMDVAVLAAQVVEAAARQGGVVPELQAPSPVIVPLRPVAFERCLANLIGNACRYAAHRVQVAVEGGEGGEAREGEGREAHITIDDDGPGIPPDRYEDVFRPFYRLDESRNAESGGVGLGLPIARDIVHAHGGRIELGRSPLGGLRVRVYLPA